MWKISKAIYLISFLFHISYILYFIDRWIISNGNSILRYPIFTFLGHFSFPRNICLISLKVVKKSDFHCFLKITFRVHFTGFGGGTGGILCYFSSETIITCICQINVQFAKCIFPICQMYLSNLPNVFIQFAKCICPIGKMYLSYLQNVFVQFDKCICPPLVEALLVPLNQQNGSKPQNSPKPRCYNRKRTPIYVQHVQLS